MFWFWFYQIKNLIKKTNVRKKYYIVNEKYEAVFSAKFADYKA